MLLYLVRHGDPNYEKDCLTERGWAQARSAAERLRRSGIGRIYSSPMGRARETAQPACELLGLPCHIEDWCYELPIEENGTLYPDSARKGLLELPNSVWREHGNIDLDYAHALDCPELIDCRLDRAVERVTKGGNDFLNRLGYRAEGGAFRIVRPNDDRVALFCHAAFTRTWLSVLLHIPVHLVFAGLQPTHTAVTVLEFRNYETGTTAPKCLCFGDVSHLYADGLDLLHDNRVTL